MLKLNLAQLLVEAQYFLSCLYFIPPPPKIYVCKYV